MTTSPTHSSLQAAALRRAAEVLGGIEALSRRLRQAVPSVQEWMEGSRPVPQSVFFVVADILTEHELRLALQQSQSTANPALKDEPSGEEPPESSGR